MGVEGVGVGKGARGPIGSQSSGALRYGNAASPCIDSSFKLRISARARAHLAPLHDCVCSACVRAYVSGRAIAHKYPDTLIDLQPRYANFAPVQYELMGNLCPPTALRIYLSEFELMEYEFKLSFFFFFFSSRMIYYKVCIESVIDIAAQVNCDFRSVCNC